MTWEGFAYAGAAAIGHSCIDASRKLASQKFSSAELLALVGLLDATILSSVVIGYGLISTSTLRAVQKDLAGVLGVSSGIKLVAGYMYQRALHISPLSVTIPYLAFTPVLLVFTSYILMHEMPSVQGLIGVVVVTLGGYFLAIDNSGETDSKKEKPLPSSRSSETSSSILPRAFFSAWRGSEKSSIQSLEQVMELDVVVDSGEVLRNVFPPVGVKETSLRPVDWLFALVNHVLEPIFALRKEEGSLLMLGVAVLLSISNGFDKLGLHMAPSFVIFAALQKIIMAIPLVLYLATTSPKSFLHLGRHCLPLLAISVFEVVSLCCYMKSLETLLVSYSIAAKRSNVLLSVILGSVVFKENIWRRLPFVFLMLLGMILILLA